MKKAAVLTGLVIIMGLFSGCGLFGRTYTIGVKPALSDITKIHAYSSGMSAADCWEYTVRKMDDGFVVEAEWAMYGGEQATVSISETSWNHMLTILDGSQYKKERKNPFQGMILDGSSAGVDITFPGGPEDHYVVHFAEASNFSKLAKMVFKETGSSHAPYCEAEESWKGLSVGVTSELSENCFGFELVPGDDGKLYLTGTCRDDAGHGFMRDEENKLPVSDQAVTALQALNLDLLEDYVEKESDEIALDEDSCSLTLYCGDALNPREVAASRRLIYEVGRILKEEMINADERTPDTLEGFIIEAEKAFPGQILRVFAGIGEYNGEYTANVKYEDGHFVGPFTVYEKEWLEFVRSAVNLSEEATEEGETAVLTFCYFGGEKKTFNVPFEKAGDLAGHVLGTVERPE